MAQTIRFDNNTKVLLKELSNTLNLSESKIISLSVKQFANNINGSKLSDEDIKRIIDSIQDSTWGLQVRLNSREAAVDSQILLEMLNTITQDNKKFFSTFHHPSIIFSQAKNQINEKINSRKAKKKLL